MRCGWPQLRRPSESRPGSPGGDDARQRRWRGPQPPAERSAAHRLGAAVKIVQSPFELRGVHGWKVHQPQVDAGAIMDQFRSRGCRRSRDAGFGPAIHGRPPRRRHRWAWPARGRPDPSARPRCVPASGDHGQADLYIVAFMDKFARGRPPHPGACSAYHDDFRHGPPHLVAVPRASAAAAGRAG